jgi:hypothetical protein
MRRIIADRNCAYLTAYDPALSRLLNDSTSTNTAYLIARDAAKLRQIYERILCRWRQSHNDVVMECAESRRRRQST